jgi:hypothetical protein
MNVAAGSRPNRRVVVEGGSWTAFRARAPIGLGLSSSRPRGRPLSSLMTGETLRDVSADPPVSSALEARMASGRSRRAGETFDVPQGR